jgi:hypothetical protein
MKAKTIALILVTIAMLVPLAFNACQRSVSASAVGGSGAGNPMIVHAAKSLLTSFCSTLTRCNAQLTMDSCRSGILGAGGFDSALGITATFATFADIVNSEESAALNGNASAAISCATSVTALSCGSQGVIDAYNLMAVDSFAQAARIVPSDSASGCSATFASTTTRYVAGTGDDANEGSPDRPWRTIQHALDTISAGMTVVVREGVYQEALKFKTGGTANAPVVLRSENRLGAKIAPIDTTGNSDFVIYSYGLSFITVQDFEITGTTTSKAGVRIEAGAHNAVIGNSIHAIGNTTASCPRIVGVDAACDHAVVAGNRVWNIGSPRTVAYICNQQHGIAIWKGVNGIIQNNLIFQIWQGYGVHVDAYDFSNWTVSNNTVVDSGNPNNATGGPFIFWCESGICDYNTITNNLFAIGGGTRCVSETNNGGTIGTHNIYQNNLLHGCGGVSMVTGVLQNTISSPPLFVNDSGDSNSDYGLQGTSPAKDAGTLIGAPPTDLNGEARPAGNGIDIGAFER